MITTFSNRTNIFVKWKTDNEKLRIKTEVKSKFKIILTTFDKEFNRKMSIRSLKLLVFSKTSAILANLQISKKIWRNRSQSNEVENRKSWVFFSFISKRGQLRYLYMRYLWGTLHDTMIEISFRVGTLKYVPLLACFKKRGIYEK
jgi:hypothetical protein